MDIDKIILGCKKGDRLAQKQLFESFAQLFYAVSKRYTPISHDPMDNLHDGFIRIFDKISTFDGQKGNFESWGRRVIINCALQKLKKKSRVNEIYPDQLYDSQVDEFDVVGKMSVDDLFNKIEQLPDGYKQVFCLYEIEGYSHKEIGEMLGIKEVSSRSNLSRSKKLLQELLRFEGSSYSNMINTNTSQ